MPAIRRRQIWLAKISLEKRDPNQLLLVHEQFLERIIEALNPDREISYYGRAWHLSVPELSESTQTISGKLGFDRGSRAEEVHYDDYEHDWISEEAPTRQGNYSHFVIDLDTQVIAFEEKGKELSRQSFVNAMAKYLRPVGYEIKLMSDTHTFEEWLDNVDLVTRFRVTLKRPNARWTVRAKRARQAAEEIAAERLSLEAESEQGLNVRDSLLGGAAENAAKGNGYFKASGMKNGARRFYDSSTKFLGAVIGLTDFDSSESTAEKIQDALREALSEESDDGGRKSD